MSQSNLDQPLKVLSLNAYIMGHITYQDGLERLFAAHFPNIDFQSLHLTDYFKTDPLGRLVHLLLRQRLWSSPIDYDFYRLRIEVGNSFFARRCLERAIASARPDVLHIHTQSIALLATPLLRRIPTIISLDATSALLQRYHAFPASFTYRPIVALEQQCFRHASHIITWSEWARQSVIVDYQIAPERVTAIHPTIAADLFLALPRSLSPPGHRPRLLFVGNDFERKGGADLLAVFQAHFADHCELDLVTNALIAAPTLPNIRIHRGYRPFSPELLDLYRQADIFVMPTREDVYGIVFQEAIAAGLPCIGTNIMAVPEMVQDGVNGFTVSPGDRAALAQALQTLVDNPELRLAMGFKGRAIAQEKFDPVQNCAQIADLLTRCAHTKTR